MAVEFRCLLCPPTEDGQHPEIPGTEGPVVHGADMSVPLANHYRRVHELPGPALPDIEDAGPYMDWLQPSGNKNLPEATGYELTFATVTGRAAMLKRVLYRD